MDREWLFSYKKREGVSEREIISSQFRHTLDPVERIHSLSEILNLTHSSSGNARFSLERVVEQVGERKRDQIISAERKLDNVYVFTLGVSCRRFVTECGCTIGEVRSFAFDKCVVFSFAAQNFPIIFRSIFRNLFWNASVMFSVNKWMKRGVTVELNYSIGKKCKKFTRLFQMYLMENWNNS